MSVTNTQISLGKKLPSSVFKKLNATLNLNLAEAQMTVLFFYPKDDTPGCTLEAQAFRDLYPEFKKIKIEIIGISRDTLKSHENFICKYQLPFPLFSDQSEDLCNTFEVIKPRNMYGKIVQGIERSTFLIDKNEIIQKEWRKVKVEGHADEVLNVARSMMGII